MELELTANQLEELAEKIFNESFSDSEYSHKWGDCDSFVQNDWIKAACRAVEGYNDVVKYVGFTKFEDIPGTSVVKKCCRICEHVDLYRPACNLRGDDIALECVCSKFELFEFEEDEDHD